MSVDDHRVNSLMLKGGDGQTNQLYDSDHLTCIACTQLMSRNYYMRACVCMCMCVHVHVHT